MPTPKPNAVRAISRAISIVDEYSFNVFDQRIHVAYQQPYARWDQPMNLFGENTGEEDQLIENLTTQLYSLIYSAFYVKGSVRAANLKDWQHPVPLSTDPIAEQFMEELSAANSTTDAPDRMWRIYSLDQQGNAFVEKNGDIRVLQGDSFEYANPAVPQLAIDTMVHLKKPREYRHLQPTFYHVNGQQMLPLGEELGRFYWNVTPEGAKVLVEQLTKVFNHYRVPFLFKCNNHPDHYNRSDGAVLYVLRRQFRIVSQLLKKVVPPVRPHLKPEIPLFSRRIIGGLSYAEDPGGNQSFGMVRSQLIARGIVKAWVGRKNGREAQYREIVRGFKRRGLNIDEPFRRSNSFWEYDFTFLTP